MFMTISRLAGPDKSSWGLRIRESVGGNADRAFMLGQQQQVDAPAPGDVRKIEMIVPKIETVDDMFESGPGDSYDSSTKVRAWLNCFLHRAVVRDALLFVLPLQDLDSFLDDDPASDPDGAAIVSDASDDEWKFVPARARQSEFFDSDSGSDHTVADSGSDCGGGRGSDSGDDCDG
jgi:hypothetical protein